MTSDDATEVRTGFAGWRAAAADLGLVLAEGHPLRWIGTLSEVPLVFELIPDAHGASRVSVSAALPDAWQRLVIIDAARALPIPKRLLTGDAAFDRAIMVHDTNSRILAVLDPETRALVADRVQRLGIYVNAGQVRLDAETGTPWDEASVRKALDGLVTLAVHLERARAAATGYALPARRNETRETLARLGELVANERAPFENRADAARTLLLEYPLAVAELLLVGLSADLVRAVAPTFLDKMQHPDVNVAVAMRLFRRWLITAADAFDARAIEGLVACLAPKEVAGIYAALAEASAHASSDVAETSLAVLAALELPRGWAARHFDRSALEAATRHLPALLSRYAAGGPPGA